jgi:hypothetical protein
VRAEPVSENSVRILWEQVAGATGYKVYHSTNSGGPFANIGSVADTSYVHSGITGGITHYYKVSAVDSNDLEGGQSLVAAYSPLGIYGNTSVTEQGGNGDGKINPGETARLSITVRNPGTTAVSNLQASLSGFDSNITVTNNNQNIGTLNGNASETVSFILNINVNSPTGPVGPFTLSLSESGGQNRTWLNTVPTFDITIHTPANVQASAGTYGNITVSWDAVSGGNVSYKVYASATANGVYTLLNASPITATSYTHSGLSEGQTRYYKVSAVDSGNREGLQSSGTPSALTWYSLPIYNDQYSGGGIANGTIHHYRFPVINGTQYRVSWTGNIRVSAYREDGTGTAWFSNSTSSGQTNTANFYGYMVLKVEGTGSGNYSLQIDSGTQALTSFGFNFPPEGMINGTINHTAKTIEVIVPFQASLLNLTPVVSYPTGGSYYCTGYTPSGAQNFLNPVKYVFNWSDGSKHTYTITVTARGLGEITIIPPNVMEETVGGFVANITVSKSAAGYGSSHQIQVAAGYSSYEWYVDSRRMSADAGSCERNFTIRATDYSVGRHTITIIVYKNGVPYSNEQSFTVVQ